MALGREKQSATLTDLCRRYRLDLVNVRSEGSAALFVAHVRDQIGNHFVLKQTLPHWGVSEIPTLRAWSGTGRAARFIAEMEPGIYLAQWLSGPSIADMPIHEPLDSRAVGRMLRRLHQVVPPDGLSNVRGRFVPGMVEGWQQLPRQ